MTVSNAFTEKERERTGKNTLRNVRLDFQLNNRDSRQVHRNTHYGVCVSKVSRIPDAGNYRAYCCREKNEKKYSCKTTYI